MKCNFCDKGLLKEWNYCPFCGAKLEKKGFFERVFGTVKLSPLRGGKAISIKISGIGKDVRIKNIHNKQCRARKREVPSLAKMAKKSFAKVVEPEAEVKRLSDGFLYKLSVPCVKHLADVDVRIVGKSLEVRAFGGDVMYFKIIGLAGEFRVVDKKLERNTLSIRMG